jgi:hypothetical protein
VARRPGKTKTALPFNGLGTSYGRTCRPHRRNGGALTPPPEQAALDYGTDEE